MTKFSVISDSGVTPSRRRSSATAGAGAGSHGGPAGGGGVGVAASGRGGGASGVTADHELFTLDEEGSGDFFDGSFVEGPEATVPATVPVAGVGVRRLAHLAALALDPALTRESLAADGSHVRMGTALSERINHKMAKGAARAFQAISKAHNVNICFVMDTTGSMHSHMVAVKAQIHSIVDGVKRMGCRIAGLAFVSYKDWCDGADRVQVKGFSPDVDEFRAYVDGIKAGGGGDEPEDVLGGLRAASELPWANDGSCKIVFHIGDAPPHGTQFYSGSDSLPSGHREDPSPAALFRAFNSQGAMYFFGKINRSTDRMLEVFSSCHLDGDGKPTPVVAFDVADVSKLLGAVLGSVSLSVSTLSATLSRDGERSVAPRDFVLVDAEPDWARVAPCAVDILTFELPTSVSSIKRQVDMKPSNKRSFVKVAPHPFAHGAVRLAHYGRMVFAKTIERARDPSTLTDRVILKEYIVPATDSSLERFRFMVDMETQTVAAKLALDFNTATTGARTEGVSRYKVKFLVAKVVRMEVPRPDGTSTVRFMSMEKELKGMSMTRITNNYKFVTSAEALAGAGAGSHAMAEDLEGKVATAIAFSHYTYHVSGGYLLVCDLQGVNAVGADAEPTLLLTDPAIHCIDDVPRFGVTNLRKHGMEGFFRSHVCNDICRALGLACPPAK